MSQHSAGPGLVSPQDGQPGKGALRHRATCGHSYKSSMLSRPFAKYVCNCTYGFSTRPPLLLFWAMRKRLCSAESTSSGLRLRALDKMKSATKKRMRVSSSCKPCTLLGPGKISCGGQYCNPLSTLGQPSVTHARA
jgi:hypothetical protein